MNKKLNQLLWQRYRQWFLALAGISLLTAIVLAFTNANDWTLGGRHARLFGAQIRTWAVYGGTDDAFVPLYSTGLVFIFWLMGFVLMVRDLKDHFNQFLFASGYRRSTIYWAKLRLSLGALTSLSVVITAVQYGIYRIVIPQGVAFNLAIPGLITTWVSGLAISLGMFAIAWFASLIIGEAISLVVTISGFTGSLISVENIYQNWTAHWSEPMAAWVAIGLWLAVAIILLIWGSYLYQRMSLEHDGEYLMFPGLRVPVYLVFVVYMTAIFSINAANLTPALWAFIISALFGYGWLWRPNLLEKWRARRSN